MNLVNTEKSLKHWLKNRVNITTATVVGFLIMGTISFGQIFGKTTIGPNVVKNATVKDNNIVIEKKGENFGKIEVNNTGNNVIGIDAEKQIVTIDNNGSVKTIVDKTGNNITSTAVSIFNSKNFTVNNNGEISSTAEKDGSAFGIYVYNDNTHAINPTKTIPKITNTGNITTIAKNGGSSVPIYVNINIPKDKTVNIVNTGILNADRTGTPQGRGELGAVYLSSLGGGKINFTNKKTINVNNGIAIETVGGVNVLNEGTINLSGNSLAVKNNAGNVTIAGTVNVKDKNKNDIKIAELFVGPTKVNVPGMIMGKDGEAIKNNDSVYLSGGLTSDTINTRGKEAKSVFLGSEDTSIGTIGKTPITLSSLNIIGNTSIEGEGTLNIKDTTINFDNNGFLTIGKASQGTKQEKIIVVPVVNPANLVIENGNVQKYNNGVAINPLGKSTLTLNNTIFNAGIVEKDITENKETVFANSTVNILGNTHINGELGVSKINVGTSAKTTASDKLTLAPTSKFIKATTLTNGTTGTTVFEIGANGENALNNSTGKVTVVGNVDFDTTTLTNDKVINLKGQADNDLTQMKYAGKTDGIYSTTYNQADKTLVFSYNKALFGNSALDSVNNILQSSNDKLSKNTGERLNQIDEVYSGNIYSETTRAMYDSLKMNEKTILSLDRTAKVGEISTHGRALYSKNTDTRNGQLNNFDTRIENSGLLAGVEYGLSENTSIGTVFSGSKQDVKIDNGKSNADLYYFGVYGNKTYGNYDFTAGLGYQLGKYDSKYNIGSLAGNDKYNSNAFNGYVQGKYIGNLDNGLSIQPKIKLGYTYLEQDDAKDINFGVSNTKITTYDTEVGVDVVKSVQFEKSKLDVIFGTSYVRTMGDTDKEFKLSTTSGNANILGAELAENVIKFNLGAEIGSENGFFYNGGLTYEFGGNNAKSYGANIGIGYKF